MRYATPENFRRALEDRLRTQAGPAGVTVQRLRRRTVFERILVRLETAAPGRWVLKGGMALEIRLGDRARRTRDLDLALRSEQRDGEAVRDLLVDSLSDDPQEDAFTFEVGPPDALATDEAGRPGWRFHVDAGLAGRLFDSVRLDIVARSAEIVRTIRRPLPGMLSFAEVPSLDVEVVDSAQHFAEKLHAYTSEYGDRPNMRVRDLPDMVLLIEDGLEPSRDLVGVVHDLFAERALQDVPKRLPDPPPQWSGPYSGLADDMDIAPKHLDGAVGVVRAFWERALAAKET
ncbi:MAG: nucleotidyl transferase AbiEii/AbiGii toxin family protein [Actinomycetota bacterium]